MFCRLVVSVEVTSRRDRLLLSVWDATKPGELERLYLDRFRPCLDPSLGGESPRGRTGEQTLADASRRLLRWDVELRRSFDRDLRRSGVRLYDFDFFWRCRGGEERDLSDEE